MLTPTLTLTLTQALLRAFYFADVADVRQLLPALANDFRRWWPAEYWEASARKNCSQPLPAGATGREALGRPR